jgi:hypothetical protein
MGLNCVWDSVFFVPFVCFVFAFLKETTMNVTRKRLTEMVSCAG